MRKFRAFNKAVISEYMSLLFKLARYSLTFLVIVRSFSGAVCNSHHALISRNERMTKIVGNRASARTCVRNTYSAGKIKGVSRIYECVDVADHLSVMNSTVIYSCNSNTATAVKMLLLTQHFYKYGSCLFFSRIPCYMTHNRIPFCLKIYYSLFGF